MQSGESQPQIADSAGSFAPRRAHPTLRPLAIVTFFLLLAQFLIGMLLTLRTR